MISKDVIVMATEKRLHFNVETGNTIACKKASCTLTHSDNANELKISESQKLFDELSSKPSALPMRHPQFNDVLRFVGNYCDMMNYDVRAVCPSGSDLYRTNTTDKRHDYDFVVFVDADWTSYRHAVFGNVDLFFVPILQIQKYVSQSQIIEALFGVMSGYAFYVNDLALPFSTIALQKQYFEKVGEHVAKYEANEYTDDRLKQKIKHLIRWQLYLERDKNKLFDPKLTNSERNKFLAELSQHQ